MQIANLCSPLNELCRGKGPRTLGQPALLTMSAASANMKTQAAELRAGQAAVVG
jgi:hypothetical protein